MRKYLVVAAIAASLAASSQAAPPPVQLPSGFAITPLAAPGADFQRLPTHLRADGSADANGAVTAAKSPDGTALLVLTSGFNTNFYTEQKQKITHAVLDPVTGQRSGTTTPNAEWIFLYDIRGTTPILKQSLNLPNTFHGLVWDPSGRRFYVSAGIDDRIYVFATNGAASSADASFAPDPPFIPLGHNSAPSKPLAAYDGGPRQNPDRPVGNSLQGDRRPHVVARRRPRAQRRRQNPRRRQHAEQFPEPDRHLHAKNPPRSAFLHPRPNPGLGELPYWVAIRSGTDHTSRAPTSPANATARCCPSPRTAPSNHSGRRRAEPRRAVARSGEFYVANGDKDEIEEIDTNTDTLRRRISLLRPGDTMRGAGPDGLATSADGATLYVTLSNENAVAASICRRVPCAAASPPAGSPATWRPAATDAAFTSSTRKTFPAPATSSSSAVMATSIFRRAAITATCWRLKKPAC